jgi:hypothetical protein
MNLSSSLTGVDNASIAVDNMGWVHVVWAEGGGLFHRFYDGNRWSAPVWAAAGHSPDLTADAGGGLYLAFVNSFDGADDVYVSAWQAGSGWGFWSNVSQSDDLSTSPSLAIGLDGELAVVWSEQTMDASLIYVGRSMDGLLWSTFPLPDANGSRPVSCFDPSGGLWVAWQDTLGGVLPTEVFASYWSAGEWTMPEDISATFDADSNLPTIVAGPDRVYLAWQEGPIGAEAVYMSEYADGGWTIPQKRSGASRAFGPSLARSGVDGHLAWTTEAAVHHVSWSTQTDVWQLVEEVAGGQTGVLAVDVAAGSHANVIWMAVTPAQVYDVYSSRRDLGGEPTATPEPSATAMPVPVRPLFIPIVLRNAPVSPPVL